MRNDKLESTCTRCGRYGHWEKDHTQDERICDSLPPNDGPSKNRVIFADAVVRAKIASNRSDRNQVSQLITENAISDD